MMISDPITHLRSMYLCFFKGYRQYDHPIGNMHYIDVAAASIGVKLHTRFCHDGSYFFTCKPHEYNAIIGRLGWGIAV